MKNNYAYAVARIRVKEKSLLSDADVAQMVGMKDADSVMDYLIARGWGNTESGRNPSKILDVETEKNMDLMRELKIDTSVFDVLALPQKFHNLKAGIKEICSSEKTEGIYYDIDGFGGKEVTRILQEKQYSELPEDMREAAQHAYEVMVQTRDGQRCDIIVDRACLIAMQKRVEKNAAPIIRDYVNSQVAVADIRIAVRAAKTGKTINFLNEALAPCGAFEVRGLAQAAAKGADALYTYLQEHRYGDAVEALKVSPSAFERWCDNRLIETIRPQKTNPFTSGPILAFYLARENEIKTVRIILTAKQNGFKEDAIRERVREMYV